VADNIPQQAQIVNFAQKDRYLLALSNKVPSHFYRCFIVILNKKVTPADIVSITKVVELLNIIFSWD